MWYSNRSRSHRRLAQAPPLPLPAAQPVAGAPGIPMNEQAAQQWEHAVSQDTNMTSDAAVSSVEARKKSPIHDDPTMTPMERQLDAVRQENIQEADLQNSLDGAASAATQMNPSPELHRGEFQSRDGKGATPFQNPNQTATQTFV